VSLLKKGAFIGYSIGLNFEIRLIFGVFIQFFVSGSEIRALDIMRIRIHVKQGNSYQNLSKC
jgi:hypothetical protein